MSARLRQHGWLVAIVGVYLYVFPWYPRIHSANELPRAYLVKAIVDDHALSIDRQVARWGATADVSPHGGHQYSNKAPGSSFVVVPVYALVHAIAGEPSLAVTVWLCRVVSGVIPAAVFLFVLWGFLARFAPDPAIRRLVIIAYALGSMAMTYSLLYYSHQLGAICIASAWILALGVVDRRRGRGAMLGVGALAGAAVLVDYQAIFAGVPIAVYVIARLWRTVPRRDFWWSLGLAAIAAAVPIALLFGYHATCFGSPWRTGYDASETFAHFHQHGFLGITELKWDRFYGSMFAADNGLVSLAPWWLLAIPGGVVLWRRDRATVMTCAAIAIVYVLFISSINFWRGGWQIGPRYITAMLPFLLPLVATALSSWRERPIVLGAWAGTIVVGVVVYSLSAMTLPYWPDSLRDPLYEVTFRLVGDGAVAPNVAGALGVTGIAGIVPLVAGIAGLVGWAIVCVAGWRGLAIAVVVAGSVVAAFALVPHGGPEADRAYVQTLYPAVTAAW